MSEYPPTTVEEFTSHGVHFYVIRCVGLHHLGAREFSDWFRARFPTSVMILFA